MEDRIRALRALYENDGAITAEEINELRSATGVDDWLHMVKAKNERTGIFQISQGRTEAQIAADYRARTLKIMEEIANLLTEARKEHGMTIAFQIGGPDSFGRYALTMLEVTKKLC